MNAIRAVARDVFPAVLLAALLVSSLRAEDDVVRETEPTPPPPQSPAVPPVQVPMFGGQVQGGRVIIMPGLRLQVGGQGQLQVQAGNGRLPNDGADAGAAGEARKQPYLGVVAGEVAPPVRAQLDLPEGVGLSIDAVATGGPAEKAGVRQFDVIHKFNDQVVCSPEQLTTLVKVAGAGTKVPLTLIRGGHEKVVEAVLEERAVAADEDGEAIVQAMPPGLPGVQIPADIEKKLAEALARAGAGGGLLPGFVPGPMPGLLPRLQGNVRTQVLTIGPDAQSATVVSDARGTVEIRSAGGKKTVTVKDPGGKEVYSGPLDTDEDMEQVPEDHRDWVREVDAGQPAVQAFAPEAGELEEEPKEPAAAEESGPAV